MVPFFSIIMPAYNAEKYIEEAIESVLNQTFSDWELLVVNDGSIDRTEKIVSRYLKTEPRIKLVNQQNSRLGAARNTGIRNSSGTWIAFLDSDDIWVPNKLEIQHQHILQRPEVDVFFSDGYTYFEEIQLKLYYHFPVLKGFYEGKDVYKEEFSDNMIPILSVVVKREMVLKVGFQAEEKVFFGSEDWDYWLRVALNEGKFFGIEDRLFVYRVHLGGMSAKILTQRLTSISIRLKNFKGEFLSSNQIKSFKNDIFELYSNLVKNKMHSDAEMLAILVRNVSYLDQPLIKNLNSSTLKSMLIQLKSLDFGVKNKLSPKKILMFPLRFLFFPIFTKYSKHTFNLNIQYHRWKMGEKLVTRGFFYLHPTVKIEADKNGGSLLAYGLHVGAYSYVNLASAKGSFVCAKDVIINKYCHLNVWGKLKIGNNVLFNNYCSLNCMEEITIGDNTWFGEGVRFYDHNHQFKDRLQSFTNQGFTTGKISIGNNVWVGANTIILQNVTIGDNCVIGANNLIYKSVPANTIVKARAMEIVETIK